MNHHLDQRKKLNKPNPGFGARCAKILVDIYAYLLEGQHLRLGPSENQRTSKGWCINEQ